MILIRERIATVITNYSSTCSKARYITLTFHITHYLANLTAKIHNIRFTLDFYQIVWRCPFSKIKPYFMHGKVQMPWIGNNQTVPLHGLVVISAIFEDGMYLNLCLKMQEINIRRLWENPGWVLWIYWCHHPQIGASSQFTNS